MLQINGKTFMNLQEAVQWLLDNNALPFQSSANYIANTEIGLGTIVNPSPAKVRIGSLIFFADSKVSTVTGLTENGFIVSDKYNNLVDDVAYVTGVSINASGHLITTLSDGQTIDAGIIKQVSGFSIDGSQHLIATFNDGTTQDLGAIFSGNVNISGSLTANSIIEIMTGYSFDKNVVNSAVTLAYAGVTKTGNKITFAIAGHARNVTAYSAMIGRFLIPQAVLDKLFPLTSSYLAFGAIRLQTGPFGSYVDGSFSVEKIVNGLQAYILGFNNVLDADTDYYFRFEITFLLSDNLAL